MNPKAKLWPLVLSFKSFSRCLSMPPSSRTELKHQRSSSHFLYAQPLLRWQDTISPVGGLEEARAKWMGRSLSVLQMNAPRKASRIAKVQSPAPPFRASVLRSSASIWATKTVVSIFKHSPTAYPHSQCSSRPVYLWGRGISLFSESPSVKRRK